MKQLPNFIKILLIILVVFSININVVFAKQNYYAESLGVSTYNTDTNYQDKTTLTFTPDDNSTYMIIASWLMNENLLSYGVKAKLTRTTGTAKDFNELGYLPKDTTDWIAGGTVGIDTFGSSPGSQTYKIQYGTSHTLGTASIKEAKIIAIKLHSYDKSVQSEDRTTTTSTSFVDKLSGTFTPEAAGDYIIIATATGDGASTSYDFKIQLDIDGTTYNTVNIEPTNASDRYPWIAVKKVNLTQASHTVKIKYATENASHAAGIAHARIVALRADLFSNNYYAESEVRATTTSTSYQDQTTLTQTPLAGNYLIIGSAGLDGSSSNYEAYGQLIKDSTSYGEMLIESKDNSNQGYPYFAIKRETLINSSTTWKIQYKAESSSLTAGVKDARISVLQLGVSGSCGTANLGTYSSTSEIDTSDERCSVGTFTSFVDYGTYWLWECNGVDGGTNATCVAYDSNFECSGDIYDGRDGNTYSILEIGNQCWMGENLNYYYASGYYECLFNYCTTGKGAHYEVDEIGSSNCPFGWHLPNNTEWDTLSNYLGGSSVAGGRLKVGGDTGFNAYLTGYYDSEDPYDAGDVGYFYSSSSPVGYDYYVYTVDNTSATFQQSLKPSHYYVPIRCIKDSTTGVCGTANLGNYFSTDEIDTSDERCSAGTFTSFTDNGSSWSWSCTGSGGGTTANCSAYKDELSGVEYGVSGTYRWPVPEGVYSIDITAVGGGGGGKGGHNYDYGGSYYGGAGGNNGTTTTQNTISVTPNQILTITIGAKGNGGAGGTSTAGNGTAGTASSVTGTGVSVSASGGLLQSNDYTTDDGGPGSNGYGGGTYAMNGTDADDCGYGTVYGGAAGTGYGAGGGGGGTVGCQGYYGGNGGNGAPGYVKISLYANGSCGSFDGETLTSEPAVSEKVTNGGFESGLTGWTADPLTLITNPALCFSGNQCIEMWDGYTDPWAYQSIDLTNVDKITYIIKDDVGSVFKIDNVTVDSWGVIGSWTKRTVDVSSYSGIHEIKFYAGDDAILSIDDVSAVTSLCSTGTASSVTTNPTTYEWTCNGLNGGTSASCSASKIVNNDGVCDPLTNGTTVASEPTTNLCTTGTASAVSGSGPWNWTCAVTEEFTDPIVNGSFDGTWTGWSTSGGSSTRIVDDTNPYSGTYNAYINYNLTCSKEEIYQSVTVPNVEGTINLEFWEKTWMETWGGYGGVEINNSCVWCVSYGDADRRNITTNWAKKTIDVSAYKGQTIKIGIVFYDTHPTNCDNGDHHGWVKIDEMELVTTGDVILGEIDSCYANESGTKVNGTCGSANYTTVSSEPTTNLCSAGTISSVTTSSTTYTWTCSGIDGGSNESCVANMDGEVTNGFCGSSDRQYFISIPATNLCSAGAPSSILGSGPWLWTCNGVGTGSTNDACVGNKTMPRWRETSPL